MLCIIYMGREGVVVAVLVVVVVVLVAEAEIAEAAT